MYKKGVEIESFLFFYSSLEKYMQACAYNFTKSEGKKSMQIIAFPSVIFP